MKKTEICAHCGADYLPKRRGAQKFCKTSCRTRHWQLQQKLEKRETQFQKESNTPKDKKGIEQMSIPGVANSAAGVGIVELLKHIMGINPATKKDIHELKTIILGSRYLPIINLPKNIYQKTPYYDCETKKLVYL